MLKYIKRIGLSFIFLFALFALSSNSAWAAEPAVPHIVGINDYKVYSLSNPVVTGLTAAGTDVLVYVDGEFLGYAEVNSKGTETDNFFYQIKNLSEGHHNVYVIAVDKDSLDWSKESAKAFFTIEAISAPTLIKPNEYTITAKPKHLIEGFTRSGTFVHLYIDGVYNGKTETVEDKSGTAHFLYRPFLNLGVGRHVMWAVAEDKNGRKSKVSKAVYFDIEEQFPAPTLFQPQFIAGPDYNKPIFKGLAKNNSRIEVYIDKDYNGEFVVKNHESGTANFAYRPSEPLSDDDHFIYMVAYDERGKESIWSNIIYFEVYKSKPEPVISPEISEEGALEESDTQDEVREDSVEDKEGDSDDLSDKRDEKVEKYLSFAESYQSNKNLRLSEEQYNELEEIIYNVSSYDLSNDEKRKLELLLESRNVEIAEEDMESPEVTDNNNEDLVGPGDEEISTSSNNRGGPINEDRESQSKLGWNALIFLLFLLAVIAWIFWVNRELIKERRELEKENDKEK